MTKRNLMHRYIPRLTVRKPPLLFLQIDQPKINMTHD